MRTAYCLAVLLGFSVSTVLLGALHAWYGLVHVEEPQQQEACGGSLLPERKCLLYQAHSLPPRSNRFNRRTACTAGANELQFYLSLFNAQLPIESQYIKALPDALNAEVGWPDF